MLEDPREPAPTGGGEQEYLLLRLHAPQILRRLTVVSAPLLTVIVAAACGGGSNSEPGDDHPDPAPTLYSLVDAINRGDTQSFYNGLSADRRANTKAEDVQRALQTVQLILGYVPKLEITDVGAKRIDGDSAEVDTTLTVQLRGGGIPVTDTAILKWEDGGWHLGDHFLDQALAVLGLSGGAPSSSASPTSAP